MDIKGKHIVVFGLGMTGVSVARFLVGQGARVTCTDTASMEALSPEAIELGRLGVTLELGGHAMRTLVDADLIVPSPGVPHTLQPIRDACARGVPVIGEIELASRFISEPILAVTGTNGKTTVTTLLARMLSASGMEVFVGGNIGNPLIDYVANDQKADWLVVEVSSFQLDTIDTFRPRGAVLLNITQDHMDRYPDFEAYVNSKARIFQNQREDDFAVLNGGDTEICKMASGLGARKFFFNHEGADGKRVENGVEILPDALKFYESGKQPWRLSLSRFTPPGPHNRENAAASCLAALMAGAKPEAIAWALENFKALSHRLQTVGSMDEVTYVNDSKATNVDAAAKAICTFDSPLVLIMGGRDKDSDFSPLKQLIKDRVKALILMGEAAGKIGEVLGNIVETRTVWDMKEAVKAARGFAKSGEVVLLAPGCASFDQYTSYKARGEDFKKTVENLMAGDKR